MNNAVAVYHATKLNLTEINQKKFYDLFLFRQNPFRLQQFKGVILAMVMAYQHQEIEKARYSELKDAANRTVSAITDAFSNMMRIMHEDKIPELSPFYVPPKINTYGISSVHEIKSNMEPLETSPAASLIFLRDMNSAKQMALDAIASIEKRIPLLEAKPDKVREDYQLLSKLQGSLETQNYILEKELSDEN